MTRSRASAKQAGSSFERLEADHLALELNNPDIDRLAKTGQADRGDLGAVWFAGHRLALELKDYGGRLELPKWVGEAKREAIHYGAVAGWVIAKRRGTRRPEEQWAVATVAELTCLINIANEVTAERDALRLALKASQ